MTWHRVTPSISLGHKLFFLFLFKKQPQMLNLTGRFSRHLHVQRKKTLAASCKPRGLRRDLCEDSSDTPPRSLVPHVLLCNERRSSLSSPHRPCGGCREEPRSPAGLCVKGLPRRPERKEKEDPRGSPAARTAIPDAGCVSFAQSPEGRGCRVATSLPVSCKPAGAAGAGAGLPVPDGCGPRASSAGSSWPLARSPR